MKLLVTSGMHKGKYGKVTHETHNSVMLRTDQGIEVIVTKERCVEYTKENAEKFAPAKASQFGKVLQFSR